MKRSRSLAVVAVDGGGVGSSGGNDNTNMDISTPNQPDDDPALSTDNPLTNPKKPEEPCEGDVAGGDNYTLQPYSFPRKRRSSFRGRRPTARNIDNRNIEEIRLTSPYKRFLTIKATDDAVDLRKINTIKAYEELSACLGGSPELSETRKGTLILQSRNEQITRKAKTIESLAGVPVTVEDHDRLNEARGTIWYANHPNFSEEEILNALEKYGVKNVYRTKRKQNNTLIPTSIYILTFNNCNLPTSVLLGWTKCSVRLYIPKPRRCFKCQAFGHGANNCRQEVGRCTNCSLEVHELPCERDPKCCNCQGDHPANSTNCPVYRSEQEVLATQAREGISYMEARKKVRATFVRPQVTFAAAVSGPRESTHAISQKSKSNERPSTSVQPAGDPTGSSQEDAPVTQASHEVHLGEKNEPARRNMSKEPRQSNPPLSDRNPVTYQKMGKSDKAVCRINPGSTVVHIPSRKRPQEQPPSPDPSVRPKVPKKPTTTAGPIEDQPSRTTSTSHRSRSGERSEKPRSQVEQPTSKKQPSPNKPVPPDVEMRTWDEQRRQNEPKPIPTVITTQSKHQTSPNRKYSNR